VNQKIYIVLTVYKGICSGVMSFSQYLVNIEHYDQADHMDRLASTHHTCSQGVVLAVCSFDSLSTSNSLLLCSRHFTDHWKNVTWCL